MTTMTAELVVQQIDAKALKEFVQGVGGGFHGIEVFDQFTNGAGMFCHGAGHAFRRADRFKVARGKGSAPLIAPGGGVTLVVWPVQLV